MKTIAFLSLIFCTINVTAQRLRVLVVTNGCICDIQKIDSTGNLVGKVVRVTDDTSRFALNGFYKGLNITCDSVSKAYPLFYDLPSQIIETDFNCRKEIKKRFYKHFPLNKNNRYLHGLGSIYGLHFVFSQQADVDYFFYYVVHGFAKEDLKHIYASLPKYNMETIDQTFVSVEGDLIFTYTRDNKIYYYYHIKPIGPSE